MVNFGYRKVAWHLYRRILIFVRAHLISCNNVSHGSKFVMFHISYKRVSLQVLLSLKHFNWICSVTVYDKIGIDCALSGCLQKDNSIDTSKLHVIRKKHNLMTTTTNIRKKIVCVFKRYTLRLFSSYHQLKISIMVGLRLFWNRYRADKKKSLKSAD